MSKDKKRDETKKPKKISVEAEVALLGLLLAIVSLIGLLNQGWLGGFFTYCLVYLFGSMYFVILLFNVYFGLYLFFKKTPENTAQPECHFYRTRPWLPPGRLSNRIWLI